MEPQTVYLVSHQLASDAHLCHRPWSSRQCTWSHTGWPVMHFSALDLGVSDSVPGLASVGALLCHRPWSPRQCTWYHTSWSVMHISVIDLGAPDKRTWSHTSWPVMHFSAIDLGVSDSVPGLTLIGQCCTSLPEALESQTVYQNKLFFSYNVHMQSYNV
jgi:hypothetical protein